MSKINQEIAQKIINEFCEGLSSCELATKYNLWQTTICNVIGGRSWKQCSRPNDINELIKSRHDKGLFKKGKICYIDAHPLSELQMDILTGSLLGDGSIKRGNANNSFSKKQHKNKIDYLNWHFDVLKPYGSKIIPTFSKEKLVGGKKGIIIERKKVKKYLSGYSFYTHQHPVFTELYKLWYPNKKKIIPNNLTLNPQRIAIWYFDDGSNCIENRTAVICTQSFTLDEANFLCDKLKSFDLTPKITKVTSQYTGIEMPILKFTKSSYDNLISMVKPYCLWKCFDYKIKWRKALRQWETSGKFNEQEILDIIQERKIKSAKQIAIERRVHINTIFAIASGRSWKHLSKVVD